MSAIALFKQNLKISLPAAAFGALLGFVISQGIGLLAYSDVMAYKYPGTSGFRAIGTTRLEAFDRMQATALCMGIALGIIAAQSVFLVRKLRNAPEAIHRSEV